jgi:hypothetical protein
MLMAVTAEVNLESEIRSSEESVQGSDACMLVHLRLSTCFRARFDGNTSAHYTSPPKWDRKYAQVVDEFQSLVGLRTTISAAINCVGPPHISSVFRRVCQVSAVLSITDPAYNIQAAHTILCKIKCRRGGTDSG